MIEVKQIMRLTILAKIMILSIISTIGISFLLLGCLLPSSYSPLFILLFYVFLPVPLMIATVCNRNGENTGVTELAIFITAVLLVSTFGLPVVIYTKDFIKTQTLVFSLIGNLVLICTGIVYVFLFHRDRNEFY